ncbi:acetate--CoA ligase [Shewanella sp. 202IG2-18]|uniref:acetate--CoA ligase n=1 Tax=Parashewanella hymeniacidonis TaxID=2807618 RepID=UPI00195F4FFB|nr:acetate--CoA ligase [Parashewanella hymeniacidonis]MBM7073885.1 acetate--CoA ligase [Parashewanella hymeniacidonis]
MTQFEQSDIFYPSSEVTEQANVPEYDKLYQYSIENRETFWAEQAESLSWFKKWDSVLDESNAPMYKWFDGGEINIVHNAVDRHLDNANRNKMAIIWEGENGEKRNFSYNGLNREVCQFANVLKSMGVEKGDVVTIYMPQIPELVFAMLACAKIGAVHSVVYGGFSTDALASRIDDAHSRVLITADGGSRRGKKINLKAIANDAMKRSPSIEVCICVKNNELDVEMEPSRDFWLHDLKALPIAGSKCETEQTNAEDPLFILYTSGTTGSPKGMVHTHGGYAVYTSTTHRMAFDIKPQDRWWCAADPGWITGHSYIVYGPLINGATIMLYDGAPNYPYPNRWWQIIENYGINILYTSPTAIRGLMRFGERWPKKHDLSSLRLLGSVGEPINPKAWKWYHHVIGNDKCPIIDTWWQTETGGFMICPLPITPLKPGSATKPFFGNEISIVNDEGAEVGANQEGKLIIKNPWPGMARTVFKDEQRYKDLYWSQVDGEWRYLAGDSAKKDEDGDIWVIGRIDEVLKVSGYRLGTAEIEHALVSHPVVTEAAAVGLPHELKGNAIHTYVVLKDGVVADKNLVQELKEHVGAEMGKIATPEDVQFVEGLPKTRSGKIMRRVLKARALGQDEGDLSTLEE